jgi:F-type H+-transporting ATPase subunit b
MPIDWFTIIAQTINFLILLWLLKRFLYRPIIDGLDAREKKIADILADADNKKIRAKTLQNEYEQKLSEIETERLKSHNSATKAAEAAAKNLLDEAQLDAESLVKKRLVALQLEVNQLKHDVLQKSVHEIYAQCRKILDDLAGVELDHLMFDKLLQRLDELNTEHTEQLVNALDACDNKVLIRSAFELNPAQLERLQAGIQTKLTTAKQGQIVFTQSKVPELISGLELTLSGWKLPWSVHNYLTELQQHLDAILELAPVSKDEKDSQ